MNLASSRTSMFYITLAINHCMIMELKQSSLAYFMALSVIWQAQAAVNSILRFIFEGGCVYASMLWVLQISEIAH